MSKRTRTLALLLVVLIITGCVPKTVVVQPGNPIPQQRWDQPIYVTATPYVTYSEWTYEDARRYAGVVRFTDRVNGHNVVCYYERNLGLACAALCDDAKE